MTKNKNMLVLLSKMKCFLPSIFGRMFFADAGKRESQQSLTLAVDWLVVSYLSFCSPSFSFSGWGWKKVNN
jgi:hypothetical protein